MEGKMKGEEKKEIARTLIAQLRAKKIDDHNCQLIFSTAYSLIRHSKV